MSKSVWGCPVHFDSKGGSSVEDTTFDEGGYMGLPANDPIRAGYTFAGWSTTDGGSVIDLPYSPSGSQAITLYAKWVASSHKVTFDSKGGSAITEDSFADAGSIIAPSAPTRAGYTFLGWSATDGGSALEFPYSPGVSSDVTLYALWSADSHTVTFNSKGGTAVSAGSFITDGSFTAPSAPTRSGYSFLGWSATDGGSAVEFPYSPGVTTDVTLYALWSADGHTVTFDSKGGSAVPSGSFVTGGSIFNSYHLLDGSTIPENSFQSPLELGLKMSSSADGWVKKVTFYKYAGDNSVHTANVWSSTGILLASQNFADETESGWQSVTLNDPVRIDANQSFTVSVFSDAYRFNGSFTNSLPSRTSGPLTIIDGFYRYTSVSAYPSQTVNLQYNVNLEFASVPSDPTRSGYTFQGWSASDGGEAVSFPYAPGVTEDITLYAKWSADSHTVTFNSKGGSVVSAGSFVSGGSLTAPTPPTRAGYIFQGWSASDGGSAVSFPYSPGVVTDVTLYAKWVLKVFTLTYVTSGGSSVPAASFTIGSAIASAPSVPVRAGFVFAGWSASDGGSAVSFPYSPGVVSNVSLYAKWTALPPLFGVTSSSVVLPGSLVSVNVSRVNQGCTVSVGWVGSNVAPVSRVVRADRTTGLFTVAVPSVAGVYVLSTGQIGAECSGGQAVTLSQSVVVGKAASIVAKLVSSSASVSKSPLVRVSGTVKVGSVVVAGKSFVVSLRKDGVQVKSLSAVTDGSGVFDVAFPGTSYVAGVYTAVVSFVADATYLSAQTTTTGLTLR
jgi:uncharacterized repeat protein (TIGR02543 family)